MEESKACPKCGMLMIVKMYHTGTGLRDWRCNCGHAETGPEIKEKTQEERLNDRWREVNRKSLTHEGETCTVQGPGGKEYTVYA